MVSVPDVRVMSTDAAPAPGGHYSQAIASRGFIFISGQLPIASGDTEEQGMDFECQVRRALGNLLAILKAAGGSPAGLVKVTAYIVDVAHWPTFNRVYAEMLGNARPARSVVPVPALHHGYLVEIEAISVCSG